MLISVRADLHGTIYLQRERIKALEKRIQQNQDALNTLSAERAKVSDNLAQATAYRDPLKTAADKTHKILSSMEVLATKSEIKATQALAALSEIESAQIFAELLKIKVMQSLTELPETAASQSAKEWLKTTTTQALTQLPKTQAAQIFAQLLERHLGQDLGKLSQENMTKALKALAELSKAQAAMETVSTRLEKYTSDAVKNVYDIKRFQFELSNLNFHINKAEKKILTEINILETLKLTLNRIEEKRMRKQEILGVLESKQPGFFAQRRSEQEALVKELISPIAEALLHHFPNQDEWDNTLRKSHANSPRQR